MTAISPVSTAYTQNLAFRANDETQKTKRHPFKAVLLYNLPGIGELTNGDTKNGLKHLIAGVALCAAALPLYLKNMLPAIKNNAKEAEKILSEKGIISKEYIKTALKGISKKTLAGIAVISVLGTGNAIASAIGTYKGKQAPKEF